MMTTCRSLATLVIVLLSLIAALGQTPTRPTTERQLPDTPPLTPTLTQTSPQTSSVNVTATASANSVRYISVGEVQQTRLQVFSTLGLQVYDSSFRLGNLIDWPLVDQQGIALTDGSYLFLVTVKDFSERLTQKYGIAILEEGQVSLEQTQRAELTPTLSTALESNQQADSLSVIDRIGAAGLNRAASTDGTAITNESTATTSTSKESSSDPSINAASTGTQNRIAKWIDNAGNLGDSAVTEVSGNVGIGTITPSNKLHVTKDDVYTSLYGQLLLSGASDQSMRLALGYDTTNNLGWLQAYRNSVGFTPLSLNPSGGNVGIGTTSPGARLEVNGNIYVPNSYGFLANNGQAGMVVRTANNLDFHNGNNVRMTIQTGGNVGIGTATPSNKLHVTKDDTYTSLYGQLLLSGATDPSFRLALGYDTSNDFGWLQAYRNSVGLRPLSLNPNGGNVGIGTVAPNQKLSVNGVIESMAGGFKFPDATILTSASTLSKILASRVTISNANSPYSAGTTEDIIGVNVTSAPVTVILPAANSVSSGKILIVKNEAGDASVNNITIQRRGSDFINANQTSVAITFGIGTAAFKFYSDGVSRWYQF